MSLKIDTADERKCCLYNAKNKTRVFQLFSNHLIEYIHESTEQELLELLQNPECLEVIQEYTYEVIEIIVMIMDEEHKDDKKKINDVCRKIMVFLATHCQANELILYIVEQLALSTNKPHFQVLLSTLRLCLLRCRNLFKMLDMCVDVIIKFLKNLPLPNYEYSEARNDSIMEQLVLSYTCTVDFIDNVYRDCLSHKNISTSASDLEHCIFKLMFSCFGGTFNYMDMSNDICYSMFEKVLSILSTEIDLMYLIHLKVDTEIKESASSGSNERIITDCSLKFNHYYPFLNIHAVQLSNLSWIVLYNQNRNAYILCVYNPIYIIFCIIQLSNYVIEEKANQNIIISRVLNLVDFALNINQMSIPMECIDTIVHDQFMQNMMNLVVTSESIKVQKYVINNLIQYINKFEIKAKYRILQKVVTSNCHVKIIGIAIGVFKDTVAQSHSKHLLDEKEKLFFDNNFQEFISKICYLKDGMKTDLIGKSDQLIPTLNFIIFFIIRKKNNNNVMQLLSSSNYEFLKSLNNLVKAQLREWKTYMDHLDEDLSENQDCIDKLQPSMKTMSMMPKDQQLLMCHQATNTLFIIQNLIIRICELTNYSVIEECSSEAVLMD